MQENSNGLVKEMDIYSETQVTQGIIMKVVMNVCGALSMFKLKWKTQELIYCSKIKF